MKFSPNKIIIIVVVATILLVLLYKYWYRTKESLIELTSELVIKKALNYIGYSNIYMREINKVTKIADLEALRKSHNALLTKLFILGGGSKKFDNFPDVYSKHIIFNVLDMRNWDYGPGLQNSPDEQKIKKSQRLLGSVVLRINKINKMIDDKIYGKTRPAIKGPAMGTFKFL